MNQLAKQGIVCKMCGNILEVVTGEPTNCDPCEKQLQLSAPAVPPEEVDEVRDIQTLITSAYLTAACVMVAEQIINREPVLRPESKEELAEEAVTLLRYHAPMAYGFYFQSYGGDNPLPAGTLDIILDLIWRNPLTSNYLGGKNHGIILPGQA